jgi:hypothetical protein
VGIVAIIVSPQVKKLMPGVDETPPTPAPEHEQVTP